MNKNQIGENAGIIWRMLESRGSLSVEQLQTETGLDLTAILTAIGWLAREDKISFNKQNGITSIYLYQEIYY
jgi:hypothetical protein